MTKSRNILPKRKHWTEVELALLTANYADSRTEDIAIALGRELQHVYAKARKLGLVKSEAYLASPDACRLRRGDEVGKNYRFPKGHVPANKGLRRPGFTAGDMAKTQFKKGQMPHTWVPVGSYRVNPDGHLEVKFSEVPGPYMLRWKTVHRTVWEAANGPVPKGYVLRFKPGRHTTDPALITLDALEFLTLAENMARNTVHNMPKELVQLVQLRGALNRQINKRSRSA